MYVTIPSYNAELLLIIVGTLIINCWSTTELQCTLIKFHKIFTMQVEGPLEQEDNHVVSSTGELNIVHHCRNESIINDYKNDKLVKGKQYESFIDFETVLREYAKLTKFDFRSFSQSQKQKNNNEDRFFRYYRCLSLFKAYHSRKKKDGIFTPCSCFWKVERIAPDGKVLIVRAEFDHAESCLEREPTMPRKKIRYASSIFGQYDEELVRQLSFIFSENKKPYLLTSVNRLLHIFGHEPLISHDEMNKLRRFVEKSKIPVADPNEVVAAPEIPAPFIDLEVEELQSAPPLFLARYEDLCQNFNSIAELAAPSVANYNALKKIYLYCKSSLSGNISLDTVYNHLIKDDKADLYFSNTRISKQILNHGKLGYVLFL